MALKEPLKSLFLSTETTQMGKDSWEPLPDSALDFSVEGYRVNGKKCWEPQFGSICRVRGSLSFLVS